jgi:hypothetical protein
VRFPRASNPVVHSLGHGHLSSIRKHQRHHEFHNNNSDTDATQIPECLLLGTFVGSHGDSSRPNLSPGARIPCSPCVPPRHLARRIISDGWQSRYEYAAPAPALCCAALTALRRSKSARTGIKLTPLFALIIFISRLPLYRHLGSLTRHSHSPAPTFVPPWVSNPSRLPITPSAHCASYQEPGSPFRSQALCHSSFGFHLRLLSSACSLPLAHLHRRR